MGVPKFFRYISERYPCLSELVREDKIPEFDNLYLDMNGIIHNCSHPDDGNVHFRITEENMFRDIFNYIDKLFYLIKPQKLFFMAVDGVAPRAKMNQQRSRRFRSAKEADEMEKNAVKRGEKLPDTARFDSNCITPGTEFMVKLQEALKYFVKVKISTNPLWQGCRIILSGHETPGEGEHKIMEYIRYLKAQPDYDETTRHCLYGLDADLIILGLCTHQPYFALLREEVSFGKKAKKASAEETRFFLLHLNLLREYLELEFSRITEMKEKEFDIEKIIDDWILMGFLVGNDFIPNLPNLHINTNALPILYEAYMKVWPNMKGYLNENGKLNLELLEMFMKEIGQQDRDLFRETYTDTEHFDGRFDNQAFDIDVSEINNRDTEDDLAKLIKDSNSFFDDMEDENGSSDDDDLFEKQFISHKRHYYRDKLKYEEMTPEVLAEQTECYVTALQWILNYYYRGVQSWGWYYPHHYAPFASDVQHFKKLKIKFDMGTPFLPYQQLLAVLPSASKELLPAAFRDLMTSPNSELIEYYPKDFLTDLNGKKNEWEAVVLIPFIDEIKLLHAMQPCLKNLSEEELKRNTHGPMYQYDYTESSQGKCPGMFSFKTVSNVFCTEKQIWRSEVAVREEDCIISEKRKERFMINFHPGFPSMKHLKYKSALKKAKVKVFDQPSRNENMIIEARNDEFVDEISPEEIATKYLNKIAYIGWPHLVKAKIVALSNESTKIDAEGVKEHMKRIFDLQVRGAHDHNYFRMGIDFKTTKILVHACTSTGSEYQLGKDGLLTLTEIWSKAETSYPLQGLVTEVQLKSTNEKKTKKIDEIFPANCSVFMLTNPYFGSEGKVIDPLLAYNCGRIKVNITVLSEPNLHEVKKCHSDMDCRYVPPYKVGNILGLQPYCISRITGSIFVVRGGPRGNLPENTSKINIGLNIKFTKNNQQLLGYTKRGTNNVWMYSDKAIKLIEEYWKVFPKLFEVITSSSSNDVYFETDLFDDPDSDFDLGTVIGWLKKHEYSQAERVACGTEYAEPEAIQLLLKAVDNMKSMPVKSVKLQVKPHLVLKPGFNIPETHLLKEKVRLFDRVVVVRQTHKVPAGYKGTVIAIHPILDPNPVRIECVKVVERFFEILFDKELPEGDGSNDVAPGRICRVSESSILVVFQERQDRDVPINRRSFVTNDNGRVQTHQSIAELYGVQPYESENARMQAVNMPQQQRPEINVRRQQGGNDNGFYPRDNSVFVYPPMYRGPNHNVNPNRNIQNNPMRNIQDNPIRNISDSIKFVHPSTSNDIKFKNSMPGMKVVLKEKYDETVNKEKCDNGTLLVTNTNTSQPTVVNFNKKFQDHNIKKDTNKESTDTTAALKLLLGLSLNAEQRQEITSNNMKQFQKFEDAQSVKNLPKPPPTWRNDACKRSNIDESQRKNRPYFQNNASYHSQPSAVFTNTQYNQFNLNQLNFNCQKDFKNNSHMPMNTPSQSQVPPVNSAGFNISTGQSAFIPLQALKTSIKPDNNQQQFEKKPARDQERKGESDSNANQTNNKRQQQQNNGNKNENVRKTAAKVRKPKIAANFDFK